MFRHTALVALVEAVAFSVPLIGTRSTTVIAVEVVLMYCCSLVTSVAMELNVRRSFPMEPAAESAPGMAAITASPQSGSNPRLKTAHASIKLQLTGSSSNSTTAAVTAGPLPPDASAIMEVVDITAVWQGFRSGGTEPAYMRHRSQHLQSLDGMACMVFAILMVSVYAIAHQPTAPMWACCISLLLRAVALMGSKHSISYRDAVLTVPVQAIFLFSNCGMRLPACTTSTALSYSELLLYGIVLPAMLQVRQSKVLIMNCLQRLHASAVGASNIVSMTC